MRNRHKTQIRQPLALLSAAGQGKKGFRNKSDSGNTGLFKITLVNYQP